MSRILYIIILISAAFFYPLYRGELSYITLIAVIALPVLTLLELLASARLLGCTPDKVNAAIYKGSEGEVKITLENKSPFPLSGVRVGVKITCMPAGEVRRQTADIPLPARSSQTVAVGLGGKNCGEVRVYLEYVKIYDLLRLFSVKLFKNKGLIGKVCIIPKVDEKYSDEAAELMYAALCASVSDENSDSRGDSGAFGDVSGYRDFIPGDKLSRLHHKLSARFDKDIVRVMSPDSSGHFLLTADLSSRLSAAAGEANGSNTPDIRDARLTKLISMAYFLVKEGADVCIAVPENIADDRVTAVTGDRYGFRCASGADCLAAAKALCGADFAGTEYSPENNSEYITVDIEEKFESQR